MRWSHKNEGTTAAMATNRTAGPGDPRGLRSLIPLESLSAGGFEQVAAAMTLRPVKAGTMLFRLGKRNNYSLYLLEGCVELSAPDSRERVEGGSDRARRPLVDARANRHTGTTVSDSVVAVIDSALLEKYLTWDQMAHKPVPGYEIREFEGTADVEWMLQMLQNEVFMRLPTGNIQTLFSRFEEYHAAPGQVVVRQGEPGDYYYIVKEGRCRVTRQGSSGDAERVLAELGPRDAFGEESLLSDEPRNATVTMLTDGSMMRLAKEDFRALMTDPLVNRIDGERMKAMMRQGAVVLDVRLESEFGNGSIPGASNVPLYLLRLKATTLDPDARYVAVCDTGARSAAAAFLLSERGLDVSVLEGGLASVAYRPDGASRGERAAT